MSIIKKGISIFTILLTIFSFSSCNNIDDEKITPPQCNLEKNVKISYKENNYEGKFINNTSGMKSFSFTFPQTLNGFTVTYRGSKYKIEYMGLERTSDTSLPITSPVEILFNVIEELYVKEPNPEIIDNGIASYKVTSGKDRYVIYSKTLNGNIIEIVGEDITIELK